MFTGEWERLLGASVIFQIQVGANDILMTILKFPHWRRLKQVI
jgi:hypothetical protein